MFFSHQTAPKPTSCWLRLNKIVTTKKLESNYNLVKFLHQRGNFSHEHDTKIGGRELLLVIYDNKTNYLTKLRVEFGGRCILQYSTVCTPMPAMCISFCHIADHSGH